MLQWAARRSTICLFMSSSPSALFRKHFYDVLSRLPDGFYKLSFFSDRHGGLIVVPVFKFELCEYFSHCFFIFLLDFYLQVFVTHFTYRMCLDIAVTNLLPLMPIAFAWLIFSVVAFVTLVLGSLVLLAVTAVCQLRTAGVSTRFLWSSGH